MYKKFSTFLSGLDLIDIGNNEALDQLFDHLQVIYDEMIRSQYLL